MGAGSWGTALATALAVNGHEVRLWGRNADMMSEMQTSRENSKYLPGVKLAENITCLSDSETALKGAEIAVYVVPAQSFRDTFEKTNSYISEDAIVVNCSKGIEQGTLKRISEIAAEIRPDLRFAVLSGPCMQRRSEKDCRLHSFRLRLTFRQLRLYRTRSCRNLCASTRTTMLSA